MLIYHSFDVDDNSWQAHYAPSTAVDIGVYHKEYLSDLAAAEAVVEKRMAVEEEQRILAQQRLRQEEDSLLDDTTSNGIASASGTVTNSSGIPISERSRSISARTMSTRSGIMIPPSSSPGHESKDGSVSASWVRRTEEIQNYKGFAEFVQPADSALVTTNTVRRERLKAKPQRSATITSDDDDSKEKERTISTAVAPAVSLATQTATSSLALAGIHGPVA
jgi:hypothetical protein